MTREQEQCRDSEIGEDFLGSDQDDDDVEDYGDTIEEEPVTFPVGPMKSFIARVQRILRQRMRRHK